MRHQWMQRLRVASPAAVLSRLFVGQLDVRHIARLSERAPGPCHQFYWSLRRLRVVALALIVLTLAALAATLADGGMRWLGAAMMLLMLALGDAVARRARSREPVIAIDLLGITDTRLRPLRISWQDIATFEPTDLTTSKTIEFHLKLPARVAADARFGLRSGAWLQRRLGLPAAAINLILVEASAIDLVRAVAAFRPELLPAEMLTSARTLSN